MTTKRRPWSPSRKKPYSRLDLGEEGAYTVRGDEDDVYLHSLPAVALSFADDVDDVYFTHGSIRSESFSPRIQDLYDSEIGNVQTKFVARGEGWDGPRYIPIKFVRGAEPCARPAPPLSFREARYVLNNIYATEDYSSVRTSSVRRAETAAIEAVTSPLPRSERQVTLLHWVCEWPDAWRGAAVLDTFYSQQWVDTHSHPAWYYPGAAQTRGYQVLLAIRAPRGTPMLRIRRHSSYSYRVKRMQPGQWTHTEMDSHEVEVRLPPGRYLVERPPTFERYADGKILLVPLLYEPWAFDRPCRSLADRLRASLRRRKATKL